MMTLQGNTLQGEAMCHAMKTLWGETIHHAMAKSMGGEVNLWKTLEGETLSGETLHSAMATLQGGTSIGGDINGGDFMG